MGARVGSIISTVSVIFFLFILWESFVRHRPAISRNHLRTSLELIHSFPPINHSYTSIPLDVCRDAQTHQPSNHTTVGKDSTSSLKRCYIQRPRFRRGGTSVRWLLSPPC